MPNILPESNGGIRYAHWLPPVDGGSQEGTPRQVAFRVFGEGPLDVVMLHGTLGSVDSPVPTPDLKDYSDYYGVDDEPDSGGVCVINESADTKRAYTPDFLDEIGVRLVLVERPGYGESEGSVPMIPLEYTARAVEAVLGTLGISEDKRVGIIGFSAGVPHALYCAAKLGARAGAVVAVGGLSPGGLRDKTANGGVTEHNTVASYWDWSDVPEFSAEVGKDVESFFKNVVKPSASDADRALLEELPGLEAAIIKSYGRSLMWFVDPESTRDVHGRHRFPFGHMSDVYLNKLGYDYVKVDGSSILDTVREAETPVLLLQGVEDTFTRPIHAQKLKEGLGEKADLRLIRAGHFAGYVLWRHTLHWLRSKIRPYLEG